MNRERFEFALERLKSAQWKTFEEFASAFLVSEFTGLRTVASPSGDRGRDSELFSPSDEPSVVLQYSVAADWEEKIKKTAKRISEEFPDASILIYVTNQPVGALADPSKKYVRQNHKLILDVRDRNWFLDRQFLDSAHQEAAAQLIHHIVDPYLASRNLAHSRIQTLSTDEMRTAFVYLKMQWADASQDKGLTRVCFEALVKAALRDTDSEHRLTREQVRQRVREVLSVHPPEIVDRYTDSALHRLEKQSIRHYRKIDEFCLTYEERQRVNDRVLQGENDESTLQREIEQVTQIKAHRLEVRLPKAEMPDLAARVRRILEKMLFQEGESFVDAIKAGEARQVTVDDITEIITKDFAEHPVKRKNVDYRQIIASSIESLIAEPSETSLRYLRSLSDTYTLLSFLRETPDVQSVMAKMFAGGTIWLDTTFILPLFAEELLGPEARRFQAIIRAAKESGLELRVTGGVVEEVERHMNRCLTFARNSTTWKGRVPFLVSVFASTGRPLNTFPSWLETFRGGRRPEDDVLDAMTRMFGIEVEDLDKEVAKANHDLLSAVQEAWYKERNRKHVVWERESQSLDRLVRHDVENYLGVIMRRRSEKDSPFGYSFWWLTLHRAAFFIRAELRKSLGSQAPASPVLSPDFLVNYLSLGPIRRRISKSTETKLPLGIDLGVIDYPPDLILQAEQAREEMRDMPEHLIRRRIRDDFDAARMQYGQVARGGLLGVEKALTGDRNTGHERKPHIRQQDARHGAG